MTRASFSGTRWHRVDARAWVNVPTRRIVKTSGTRSPANRPRRAPALDRASAVRESVCSLKRAPTNPATQELRVITASADAA